MQSFVLGPLFQFAFLQQAYKTAFSEVRPSSPRCPHWPLPRHRGAARPSSPPAPVPASFRGRRRHVPRGRASVLATSAGRGRQHRPLPALAVVAVVFVFFAAAVPAGGAHRGHVPRARESSATRRRCCGPLLRSGRPPGGARRDHVCVGIAGVEILQRGSCRKHVKSCEMLRHGK